MTLDAAAARLYAAHDAVAVAAARDADGVISDEYFTARVELAAAREAFDDALSDRAARVVATIRKA